MKTCPKCGIEKDESEFSQNKKRKDKLFFWCKRCQNEHNSNYFYSLRQKCFALFNSVCKNCGERNIDVLTVNHTQSPNSDIYKRLKRSGFKLYKQILDNPELTKHFTLLCANCNHLDYYQKSGYYSRSLAKRSIQYRKQKEKICELWNFKCFHCFRTFPVELLTVNHVNGNGRKEMKDRNNGYRKSFFQTIPTDELISRIDTGELEVLCFNCNCNRTESSKWIKHAIVQKKALNKSEKPI